MTASSPCPVLSRILANKWTLLVLAEACRGASRFKDFQERLGVAPKSLCTSLNALVELGLVVRHCHGIYQLTAAGTTIQPALAALSAWGKHHSRIPIAGRLADDAT